MRRGLLIVQSRPVRPDRAGELDDWYDNVHLPEISAVPGFVSARRYRACDRATGTPDPDNPSFLAVYELEADDLNRPLRELSARTAEGRMSTTDAICLDPPPVVTLYELHA